MIRVLLAKDQGMVRGALVALLQLEGDIEAVAEVARSDEVLPAIWAPQPDVALLDIEMPGGIATRATPLPASGSSVVTTAAYVVRGAPEA